MAQRKHRIAVIPGDGIGKETPPEGLREGSIVVQPGHSLWRIARETYGRGIRYTVIYEANRAQIRDPDLIYPGQVFVLPGAGRGG